MGDRYCVLRNDSNQVISIRGEHQVAFHDADKCRAHGGIAAECIESCSQPLLDFGAGGPSDRLALPVPQLLFVEMRGRVTAACQIKMRGHVGKIEPAVTGGGVTEAYEVVAHGAGEIA